MEQKLINMMDNIFNHFEDKYYNTWWYKRVLRLYEGLSVVVTLIVLSAIEYLLARALLWMGGIILGLIALHILIALFDIAAFFITELFGACIAWMKRKNKPPSVRWVTRKSLGGYYGYN